MIFLTFLPFLVSGQQKIYASDSSFVIPERPKCRISHRRLRKENRSFTWSFTKTRPHLIENLSTIDLYSSKALSRFSLLMLFLTRVILVSVFVFEIKLLRPNIISKSAFSYAVRYPSGLLLILNYMIDMSKMLFFAFGAEVAQIYYRHNISTHHSQNSSSVDSIPVLCQVLLLPESPWFLFRFELMSQPFSAFHQFRINLSAFLPTAFIRAI